MKTKVLYLAIMLVTVFSLTACSPDTNEDTGQPSNIDSTQLAEDENGSTTVPSGFVLILGAFAQEIDGLRRQLEIEEVITERNYDLYRGTYENTDILLVRTGMGRERVENATESILKNYPVTAIVSLGFAGGLNPESEIGDVVLCSTLYYANGSDQTDPMPESYASDASLISLASGCLEDMEANCYIGSSVAVLELDCDLQEQQELAETFNADVIEMESYWVARIASARGIPFIAIRSISDRGNDVQPFDQILSSDGELLWKEAVVCFTIHPHYLLKVFNLYMQVRVAHRNLTACVLQLVTRI
jgi:adenosylhomocysteine nucleosidase